MRSEWLWIGALGLCLNVFGSDAPDFFEKRIRPLLASSCQPCHNANVKTAGLDFSSGEGFHLGGQSGALVNKTAPEESLLLKVTSFDDRLKMPPTGKLTPQQLADLQAWVKAGAVWPGVDASALRSTKQSSPHEFTEEEKSYWAFQPVRKPQPPVVKDTSWARSDIDRFILAKLEEKGLKPAPQADKLTLLRRATYDLTGLPPTEQEIANFLADNSAQAFEKVVDRLLASPRYGERWGRHWLDVARYADSTGNDEDHRYPYAWRYRDYVISALNDDLPYDQFVREQIAGDLLPTDSPDGVNRRGIVATGFLALGAKAIAQQDKKKMLYDVYDEQVEVVSKAMMGVTLACARCHDHKFDPLLTKDYYSMLSIFANTRSFRDPSPNVAKLLYRPIAPQDVYEKYQAHQAKVNENRFAIEDIVAAEAERYTASLTPRLADYMVAARKVNREGATVDAGLAATGLNKEILTKWVELLKPTPGVIQTHLEAWHNATDEQVPAVAAKYQADFDTQWKDWNKTMRQWRNRARRMIKEMNMPPPERPRFDFTKDRFFHGVTMEDGGPFTIGKKEEAKIYSAEAKLKLEALRAQEKEFKKNAPPEPDMACSVEEGDPVKQHVFIRGDYNSLGEEVERGFPALLSRPSDPVPGKGSGRLELAEWLTRKENPLTARVMVNRIWQKRFGEGIVRTPDNLGKMGDRPTHPELLDWLAASFMDSGWSMKAMHRTLMLSSAYQMASLASEQAMAADPENRLLSRMPRRRLDIEEIRDGLLAIDGTLDTTMGGTLQSGLGTDGENNQGRLSINPEKHARRTVYLPLRRANLPTLLNLYDFGDATTVTGRRAVTNVAPQALFMMNSEFLTDRSRGLAEQLLKREYTTDRGKVEAAYLRVLNRPPSASEVDGGVIYISRYTEKFGAGPADAWQSLCRVLMASNDFIYLD
ncbi:MAG: DUF1549 domain-containing protein [Acidimicrobiia bacterium]|nr:DUF1549 domain-containing protein [Acidimicrobiia bacterium]